MPSNVIIQVPCELARWNFPNRSLINVPTKSFLVKRIKEKVEILHGFHSCGHFAYPVNGGRYWCWSQKSKPELVVRSGASASAWQPCYQLAWVHYQNINSRISWQKSWVISTPWWIWDQLLLLQLGSRTTSLGFLVVVDLVAFPAIESGAESQLRKVVRSSKRYVITNKLEEWWSMTIIAVSWSTFYFKELVHLSRLRSWQVHHALQLLL